MFSTCIFIPCRHTDDMIKKLESAGLGFYVRDTQQKLGKNSVACEIALLQPHHFLMCVYEL